MKVRSLVAAVGFAATVATAVTGSAQAYTFSQLVRATKAPATAVFASVAIPAQDAPQIERWRQVEAAADHGRHLQACWNNASSCPAGYATQWRAMMSAARGTDRLRQAEMVNSFFNQLAYRTDLENYGTSDHWARPIEFLARGAGDCEDYAVAKFFSLKLLGVPDQDRRVVALVDRSEGIGHAVLTLKVSGTWYVLDNRSNYVFADTRYHQYEPLLSMNEEAAWRNIQRRQPSTQTLASISSALTFH